MVGDAVVVTRIGLQAREGEDAGVVPDNGSHEGSGDPVEIVRSEPVENGDGSRAGRADPDTHGAVRDADAGGLIALSGSEGRNGEEKKEDKRAYGFHGGDFCGWEEGWQGGKSLFLVCRFVDIHSCWCLSRLRIISHSVRLSVAHG